MRARVIVAGALIAAGLSFSSGAQESRTARGDGDWPLYRRDLAGTGYSPLRQINLQNVADLAPAWTFRIQSNAPTAGGRGAAGGANVNSQATPIVIDGVMYFPGRDRVEALEADTGKEIWQAPVTGGAPSRRWLRPGPRHRFNGVAVKPRDPRVAPFVVRSPRDIAGSDRDELSWMRGDSDARELDERNGRNDGPR